MNPGTYDWTRFELVFYYDAPLEAVFRAWATSGGLASFFIERSVVTDGSGRARAEDESAATGDSYRWDWRQDWSVEGTFTNVVENECVAFTFGRMSVAVTFAPFEGQTEVHLVQTNIGDDPDGLVMGHLNCRSCWVFFLTNLKSVLEHGHDLRDSQSDRVASMEVGFVPLSTR
ncbi:MAG: hypothetical protein DHS20C21_01150 [Gemmatimonadota bacterium]|nr:MAG: hypothetical protein DHS20C21_01150 [Gemmatimonadota bacterium]